jgi:polyisoprenoid-binding protein YceI
MKKILSISLLLFVSLLLTTLANAKPPSWDIITDKSTLTFTASQNNAPVKGSFESFTGDIVFDPDDMSENQVTINIDMNSVKTSYKEMADTLKTAEWFNIKTFPQAKFTADAFTITDDGTYAANGNLTIRDKTVPTKLIFSLQQDGEDHIVATGTATLKRNDFGVGQGDWSSTKEIKDEVTVEFVLNATKQ